MSSESLMKNISVMFVVKNIEIAKVLYKDILRLNVLEDIGSNFDF
jgi:hypothetical protein